MKKQIEDLGSIEIAENDYGPCTVAVRLADGNVWMTQSQIARLFGVYEATVRNNLQALFKSRLVSECDITHPSWNGQSGFGTLYGLEVIIYHELPLRNSPSLCLSKMGSACFKRISA